MRTLICSLALVGLVGIGGTAPAYGREASTEISPLSDKERAELAKEEVKRRRETRNEMKEADETTYGDDSSANCGTVSIGNSNSNNQTGSGRVVQHDTTVIVTGNVYNTASCGH
jgi:hypothetical protein